MGGHLYVDESKRRHYVLVACAVVQTDLSSARAHIRELHLPGQ